MIILLEKTFKLMVEFVNNYYWNNIFYQYLNKWWYLIFDPPYWFSIFRTLRTKPPHTHPILEYEFNRYIHHLGTAIINCKISTNIISKISNSRLWYKSVRKQSSAIFYPPFWISITFTWKPKFIVFTSVIVFPKVTALSFDKKINLT